MSLKDQIIADVANVFQNTDHFAEPIQVVNPDGSIVINTDAIVFADTDEEETRGEGTFDVKIYRVFISTIDVTSITKRWHLLIGGDKFLIDNIGEDDRIAGAWLLAIRDRPKERAMDGFRRLRR